MRVSKEQIIFALVILALVLGCTVVTYFYFWAKLEQYARDQQTADHLLATFEEFRTTFHDVKPKVLIEAIESRVQPWKDARDEWGAVFHMDGWFDRFEPRSEEKFPKFWYDEESTRLLSNLRVKIIQTQPNLVFPQDIYALFGVPRLEDWKTQDDVTEEVARRALAKLSYGITLFERLLDHNVLRIDDISLWEARREPRFGEWVRLRTSGLAFSMRLRDLVNLLETFSAEYRYITVDAMRITWLRSWWEPQLDVEMLLTQALWIPPDRRPQQPRPPVVAAAMPPGQPGAPGTPGTLADQLGDRGRVQEAEPGMFAKAWKWFKRNYLYMN
ncbi:MAG TPA: hypothetical protein PKI11_00015 [Candidatus Hydrogenedentes bacterium]|nr:hypothetical protein [Candidatus Hydrogenedentota bacterium]